MCMTEYHGVRNNKEDKFMDEYMAELSDLEELVEVLSNVEKSIDEVCDNMLAACGTLKDAFDEDQTGEKIEEKTKTCVGSYDAVKEQIDSLLAFIEERIEYIIRIISISDTLTE